MPHHHHHHQHRPPPPLSPVLEDGPMRLSHLRQPSMSTPHLPLSPLSQSDTLRQHPDSINQRPLSFPSCFAREKIGIGFSDEFRGCTSLREWEMFYPLPSGGTVTVASSLSVDLDDDRVPIYRRPWCIVLYILLFCVLLGIGVAVGIARGG